MGHQYHPPLFVGETDEMPELQGLALILVHLPHPEVIARPDSRQRDGRNDYPGRPLFRAMIAGVVFALESVNFLLRDLARNIQLSQPTY